MELLNQHTKNIMEECKKRALAAGLEVEGDTLEYIITNRKLLELQPKLMIPNLYDYWVHDLEAHGDRSFYEVYPTNPYETVINTRPAISFYNDNNPDWMNVMIFYHVLAHIDFMQKNKCFRYTWDYDFEGRALSDKRLLARLRREKSEEKRWVDYAIEFARGIDNLVGYHQELRSVRDEDEKKKFGDLSEKLAFYFNHFLPEHAEATRKEQDEELARYNRIVYEYGDEKAREKIFFLEVKEDKYKNFEHIFAKHGKKKKKTAKDLLQYLIYNSEKLNNSEHEWMKQVLEVVRGTSLHFQPQIRTRIMNEGWASFWHERLFLEDERIKGHEVMFAKLHAGVTAMHRASLNPYGFGLRLWKFMRELADKGRISYEYQRLRNIKARSNYDQGTGQGMELIFQTRKYLDDAQFVGLLTPEDFQEFATRHKLWVFDKRANTDTNMWEYFIKSKKGEDYRRLLKMTLYHPPHIEIKGSKMKGNSSLYLCHHYENRILKKDWIKPVLRGIEYLWGGSVKLETTEFEVEERKAPSDLFAAHLYQPTTTRQEEPKLVKKRVLYTMSGGKITREIIWTGGPDK